MTELAANLETISKSLATLNLESQQMTPIPQINSKKRKFLRISNHYEDPEQLSQIDTSTMSKKRFRISNMQKLL